MQGSNSIPRHEGQIKAGTTGPLVTTHISEQNFRKSLGNFTQVSSQFSLEQYDISVKIVRPGSFNRVGGGPRGKISSFSWASKRRLRFIAANSRPALVSHFGLTYHNRVPSGMQVKGDLHKFLVYLKRAYPGIGYLWILEFQKRGTVHFHLFLTLPVSYGLHQFMAGRWNDISENGDEEHLAFHLNPKNFISWEMKTAGYLCKYLDKDHQKRVPEGFQEVGRFWGCSRGLVPEPRVIESQAIDTALSYGADRVSKQVLRTLCKSQEKKIRKKGKWSNWGRRSQGRYTLLEGSAILDRLLDYHEKRLSSPGFP